MYANTEAGSALGEASSTSGELYAQSARRGGGSTDMRALPAVDLAVWDLRDKVLDAPVYVLLGGNDKPSGVRMYGPVWPAARPSVSIAASEYLMGRWQYRAVRSSQSISYPHLDPTWCGGITEAQRVVALASSFGVVYSMHDCTGFGRDPGRSQMWRRCLSRAFAG